MTAQNGSKSNSASRDSCRWRFSQRFVAATSPSMRMSRCCCANSARHWRLVRSSTSPSLRGFVRASTAWPAAPRPRAAAALVKQRIQRKHSLPAAGNQLVLQRAQHLDMRLAIRRHVLVPRRQRPPRLLDLPNEGVEPLLRRRQYLRQVGSLPEHGAGTSKLLILISSPYNISFRTLYGE